MARFELTCHVQGDVRSVIAQEAGGSWTISGAGAEQVVRNRQRALQAVLEAARRFYSERLHGRDQKWGLRVSTTCGNFSFGDWSFLPSLPGAAIPQHEPIVQLYLRLRERSDREPQAALAAARELIEYCFGR